MRDHIKTTFTCQDSDRNALSVVSSSDVFVLPSIMGESITKSVIEAMSLEKAPIITDIAGNVELVIDGESGLVVPKKNHKALADAILKLYNDRQLTKKLATNAKKRIDTELSTDQTIAKVNKLYEELLQILIQRLFIFAQKFPHEHSRSI